MNQQRPKFSPQETPLSNYNSGVIAWSFFRLTYADPLGPRVSRYDPYYMYSVTVQMNNEWSEQTWFATIEDHIRIQVAGATRDSNMKATYVRDQKKRALVVQHTGGPVIARDETEVRKQVEFAVDQLMNEEGSSFAPDNIINTPSRADAEMAENLGADMLPNPFSGPLPTSVQQPQTGPQTQPVQQAQTGPQVSPPVTPSPPPPASQYQPPPSNSRNYKPFNDGEKAAWKARFADIAELQLFAYAAILERAKELSIKVKPSDQRELATSVSIQTWREFSAKGGLYGWSFIPPVVLPDNSTKDGALGCMNLYAQDQFADKTEFIKAWLDDVAEPVASIGAWKHAASIAKLLGVDSQVIFDDFEADTMMLIAQAIWTYAAARDEGMTRNESLHLVSDEYGLPEETMQFDEEEEDE